jgi:hypothetical protein
MAAKKLGVIYGVVPSHSLEPSSSPPLLLTHRHALPGYTRLGAASNQVTKGTPKRGISSGGPGYSSCSGVSKDFDPRKTGEEEAVEATAQSALGHRWGQSSLWRIIMGKVSMKEQARQLAQAPGHGRKMGFDC